MAAAIALLKTAKRPLVIVGKGCAFSRAEAEVLRFVTAAALPFLPTPMGKGVIPDDHVNSVGAARRCGRACMLVSVTCRTVEGMLVAGWQRCG